MSKGREGGNPSCLSAHQRLLPPYSARPSLPEPIFPPFLSLPSSPEVSACIQCVAIELQDTKTCMTGCTISAIIPSRLYALR